MGWLSRLGFTTGILNYLYLSFVSLYRSPRPSACAAVCLKPTRVEIYLGFALSSRCVLHSSFASFHGSEPSQLSLSLTRPPPTQSTRPARTLPYPASGLNANSLLPLSCPFVLVSNNRTPTSSKNSCSPFRTLLRLNMVNIGPRNRLLIILSRVRRRCRAWLGG